MKLLTEKNRQRQTDRQTDRWVKHNLIGEGIESSLIYCVVCTEGSRRCIVCLEDYNVGDIVTTLPCSHYYHDTCITRWLQQVTVAQYSTIHFSLTAVFTSIELSS